MSKNDEVDRFNWVRLRRLTTTPFRVKSSRWSVVTPPGEWKLIPAELELRAGAYVMILANDSAVEGFRFANGDCGWVVEASTARQTIAVKLARNSEVVEIPMIERHLHSVDKMEDVEPGGARIWGEPWFDERAEKYVVGSVRYFPLRLAWAATTHKTQGLTLDRVQIDIRNAFFGSPAMAYVAVSRCRTAEGLRIVGGERLLASRCRIDPKIQRWI